MFIEEYPGIVSQDLCEQFIARFEADPNRRPSAASVGGQPLKNDARSGTQLVCGDSPEWKTLVDALVPALQSSLRLYAAKYPAMQSVINAEGLNCTGPVIERVDPHQGFTWHYDQTTYSRQRVLAGLLYLRTIKEGGATEFLTQNRRIQPEAGKIALFPPYWTHMHRGVTPGHESKYVISFFWIYK